MKYSTIAFFFLTFLGKSFTQHIDFAIANPQPILHEVYGGRIISGDLDNDGDIDIIQSGIGEDLMGFIARASVFLSSR